MKLRNTVKPETKARAREMRRAPTPAERYLWQWLRSGRLGYNFRRQAVMRGWIADFYCPHARLIVEADGPIHDPAKDAIRDRRLSELGFLTLRFTNEEIVCKTREVLRKIHQACDQRAPVSTILEFRAQPDPQPNLQEQTTSEAFPPIHTSEDGDGSNSLCLGSRYTAETVAVETARFLNRPEGSVYACGNHWHVRESDHNV